MCCFPVLRDSPGAAAAAGGYLCWNRCSWASSVRGGCMICLSLLCISPQWVFSYSWGYKNISTINTSLSLSLCTNTDRLHHYHFFDLGLLQGRTLCPAAWLKGSFCPFYLKLFLFIALQKVLQAFLKKKKKNVCTARGVIYLLLDLFCFACFNPHQKPKVTSFVHNPNIFSFHSRIYSRRLIDLID